MPRYVLIVDFFCLAAAVIGFAMAFRQSVVRRLIGRPPSQASSMVDVDAGGDPVTYILRISGIMVMVFGLCHWRHGDAVQSGLAVQKGICA